MAVRLKIHERPRLVRFASSTVLWLYTGGLYFLSFLGPVLIIDYVRFLPAPVLLALAIAGFGVAGATFLALLVLSKKLIVGPIENTGRANLDTEDGRRWFSAVMLATILINSPFASLATGVSVLASWYYRGMGAKMAGSVVIGARTRIADPWFLEVGENVTIGGDTLILGHLGHGEDIILGRIVIGDGAIVGARSVILPDVRIGRNARVGAGAVVVRGTVIPDGETWAGVPAQKISARSAHEGMAHHA